MTRKGTLTRVEPWGFGFVRDDTTDQQYPFTFDQIAGYRGESARSFGICVGAMVDLVLRNGCVEQIAVDFTRGASSAPILVMEAP